jgi:hypothetical protein
MPGRKKRISVDDATEAVHFTRSMSPGFQVLSSAASVGPYSLMMAKNPRPGWIAALPAITLVA